MTSETKNAAQAAFDRGKKYLDNADYDNTIKELSESITLDSNNCNVYYFRGMAYSLLSQHEQAINDFNEVIRLNPNDVNAYGSRGICYMNLDQYDNCINDLNEAIRLDPSNDALYHSRGVAYYQIDQNDKSMQDLKKVIELDPNSELVASAKSFIEKIKEWLFNIGQELFEVSLKSFKNDEYNNKILAIEQFSDLIENGTDNSGLFFLRGFAYMELGKRGQAKQDLEKFISIDPKNDLVSIANIILEKIENKTEDTALIAYARCMNFINNNDYDTAITELNKFISLYPDYISAYENRGILMALKENFEQAINDFTNVIKVEQNNTKAYACRGFAYIKLNQIDKAKEDMEKYIGLNLENTTLDNVLKILNEMD